jgi:carbon monoxide dehydrogenase subunit G
VAKIAITEDRTFVLPADRARVFAFFTDLDGIRAAMVGVEKCEVGADGQVRWVLEEKVDKGIRFRPDFVVAYENNGIDHVRCRPIAGNVKNEWDVRLMPAGDGTEVHYREMVEVDLPVTALLAVLIKPLVTRELRHDVDAFLERVCQHFENRMAA